MKHIEFTTTKGDFLVIEDDCMDYDAIHDSKFKHALYQLIGGIQDITEEQANDIIKFGHYCPHNYTYHKGYWDVETNTFKEHNTA
ncbi:hypothetical protein ORI89_19170, partial [Sphingobacterium sp. UT-1RO-CII-1]|uniref:hypothetical protein n=1 Tax=Sphingobacterium sp. UT-1RO-CII-1 TaxID=2995225 RepID=UPI00227A6A02